MFLRLYRKLRAKRLGQSIGRSLPHGPEPTFPNLEWQLCTTAQTRAPAYLDWCDVIHRRPDAQRRKVWEYCYALQGLTEQLGLRAGQRGLGFGVGREPMPSVFAARGIEVVATDLSVESAQGTGWIRSREHAASLEQLLHPKICSAEQLRKHVSFRPADMNAIPEDLTGFDFCWSSCAFEHLGSIELGMRFIERSLECLKPGGVAVHTTEFNLVSNDETVDNQGTVLYRKRDLEELARRLTAKGAEVLPLNCHPGSEPLDHHIDVPPYRWVPHLRLMLGRFATTSVGIIVKRGPA
jgi:SAM-dependent methyltransferase